MSKFERFLSVWVLLCIAAGTLIGIVAGDQIKFISSLEVYHVNLPVAILIWAMIFPMMVQIDFSSLKEVRKNLKGVGLTVVVNWLIKPFTMAFFAWIFFDHVFSAFLSPEIADEYIAGAILLGAAPCTAMVFVWSYLSNGDANYTLVQVTVNDLLILVAFIPIVQFLLGITDFQVPYEVLFTSVFVFVVIPIVAGYLTSKYLTEKKGEVWFKTKFLPSLKPISIIALLSTLLLLFAFQGKQIIAQPFNILLIAIPLAIQTYFIFFLSWFSGRFLKLPYTICAPAAMIGASNFFELSVAVAIALFGLESGASLATVVGVLIEVPIMLSLVSIAKKWRF